MKPRKRVLVPVALVSIAAAVWLGARARRPHLEGLAASGTVEATEAQLGFQVAGRIEDIGVREGDAVQAGEELGHLDRSEQQARLQQMQAQADAARAFLDELERGSRPEEVAQARSGRDAARQRSLDAQRDLERTRQLFDGGAVSREALDKAATISDVARSQLEQAEEQLRLVSRGPRRERIEAQRAQLAQAEAAVRAVQANLANMILRSAFAGVVTVRHREPGETVGAGAPVLTIMNRDDRWVRIFIPENRIGEVRIGQPARIASDTEPSKTYGGEVVFVASEAEFTPKNVQTAEERVKLVYAVKVRITSDTGHDLKPGMPADVQLGPAS